MNISKLYGVKMTDLYLTERGFIFKLSDLKEPSQNYICVFSPLARYYSTLMVDFILASKKEYSAEVMVEMECALKRELGVDNITVLTGHREQFGDIGKELSGTLSSAEADSEEVWFGFKPLDDHELQIQWSKQSRRTREKNTKTLKHVQATREHHREIFLPDLLAAKRQQENSTSIQLLFSAIRPLSHSAFREASLLDGARDYEHELAVALRKGGYRPNSFDAKLVGQVAEGFRVFVSDLLLSDNLAEASRTFTHSLDVAEAGEALRESSHETLIDAIVIESERVGQFLTDVLHSIESTRIKLKKTEISSFIDSIRNISKVTHILKTVQAERRADYGLIISKDPPYGRLVGRQYPTYIARSKEAVRDLFSPTYLRKVVSGLRDDVSSLAVQYPLKSDRHITSQLYLLNASSGLRNSKSELTVATSNIGHRSTKVEAVIASNFHGYRDNQSDAYVADPLLGGSRNASFGGDVHYLGSSWRVSSFGLYLSRETSLGKRGDERSFGVALSKAFSAYRLASHGLYISQEMDSTKASKGMSVSKEVTAFRDSSQNTNLSLIVAGERGEQVASYVTKHITGKKTSRRQMTLHIDSMQSSRHKKKAMHLYDLFLQTMIRGGDFFRDIIPAYLMEDDMLFGEGLPFNSIVAEIMAAGEVTSKSAEVLSDAFISGVRERIDALMELGILAKNEKSGDLIVIEYSGAEKPRSAEIASTAVAGAREDKPASTIDDCVDGEMFRPAVLEIENPLGFINANFGQVTDSALASRPDREGQAADSIASSLINRAGEQVGFIVGSREGREGLVTNLLAGKRDDYSGSVKYLLQALKKDYGGNVDSPRVGHKSSYNAENPLSILTAKLPEFRLGCLSTETHGGWVDLRGGTNTDKVEMGRRLDCSGNLLSQDVLGHRFYDAEVLDYRLLALRPDGFALRDGELLLSSRPDSLGEIMESDISSYKLSMAHLEDAIGGGERGNKLSTIDCETTLAEGTSLESFITDESIDADSLEKRPGFLDSSSIKSLINEKISFLVTGFLFAEEEAVRAQFLSELKEAVGSERVSHLESSPLLADYERLKAVIDSDSPLGVRDISEGEVQELQMGQGLLYDYQTDVFDEPGDPEFWTRGFAMPLGYDPHDPYNAYHPWSTELDDLELLHEDWIQVSGGEWDVSKPKLSITGTSEGFSGVVLNKFDHSNYRFWTEVKVTGDNDKGVGIFFNYVDDQNHMRFVMHGGDADRSLDMGQPMQLYRVRNGRSFIVGSAMDAHPWVKGKTHRIAVDVRDSRIKLWVDGQLQYDLYV